MARQEIRVYCSSLHGYEKQVAEFFQTPPKTLPYPKSRMILEALTHYWGPYIAAVLGADSMEINRLIKLSSLSFEKQIDYLKVQTSMPDLVDKELESDDMATPDAGIFGDSFVNL